MDITSKPLAAEGLTSYRYVRHFGYIMIGATDNTDALSEAQRSMDQGQPTIENLEVWDGSQYTSVK